MNTPTIDVRLYWSLPGPRGFVRRIALAASRARVLYVNLSATPLPGTWESIADGLRHAHIPDVVDLTIRGGVDIGADIGEHFGGKSLAAQELAALNASRRTVVLLRPADEAALSACIRYAGAFLETIERCEGNVCLAVSGHDPEFTADATLNGIQVVVFDGALTPDEMDAYVGLRMIDRPGPGSTRLARAIVTEFAGFDPSFAEQIMQLDVSQIVGILEHLALLAGGSPGRWRSSAWVDGAFPLFDSSRTHTMRDHYLSENGTTDEREMAAERLRKRYWRACVKSLTPWLEERRLRVLDAFDRLIKPLTASNQGKITKVIGAMEIQVAPSELEYNDVFGLSKRLGWNFATSDEQNAIRICRLATYIRNDIAHLRLPKLPDLLELVTALDRHVPSQPAASP